MRQRIFVFALLLGGLFQLSAPPALAQTSADCLTCHSDSTLSKEGPGKTTISLLTDEAVLNKSTHAKLACVACHAGFNPDDLPHKARIQPVACQRCHADAASKHPFHRELATAISSHQEPSVSCTDCHGTHDIDSPR